MAGRTHNQEGYSTNSYRFGFNGMECDDDIKGEGNSYTTELRILDTRLGKWLSLDPMMAKFPWQSPYVSMDNNPISLTDPFGGETKDNIHIYSNGHTSVEKTDDLTDTYTLHNDDWSVAGTRTFDKKSQEGIIARNTFNYFQTAVSQYQSSNSSTTQSSSTTNLDLADYIHNAKRKYLDSWLRVSDAEHYRLEGSSDGALSGTDPPDVVAVTVSNSEILGGGGGGSFSVGWMRGNGFFYQPSINVGVGADLSLGVTLNFGWYQKAGNPH